MSLISGGDRIREARVEHLRSKTCSDKPHGIYWPYAVICSGTLIERCICCCCASQLERVPPIALGRLEVRLRNCDDAAGLKRTDATGFYHGSDGRF